jgi:hypothetical protein
VALALTGLSAAALAGPVGAIDLPSLPTVTVPTLPATTPTIGVTTSTPAPPPSTSPPPSPATPPASTQTPPPQALPPNCLAFSCRVGFDVHPGAERVAAVNNAADAVVGPHPPLAQRW